VIDWVMVKKMRKDTAASGTLDKLITEDGFHLP